MIFSNQPLGSRTFAGLLHLPFSIENDRRSGGLSEFCFQKRTQMINLSS
jgi:hypothetical protein